MPIRREHRWFYPVDWTELSALIRFDRAKSRCEECGRPHGQLVPHLGDGRWWDAEVSMWRNGRGRALKTLPPPDRWNATLRTTRVVLACAHLNHNPSDNRSRNLKAFCQRCHMIHDRPEHQRRRLLTLRMKKAIGDLFLGLYTVA